MKVLWIEDQVDRCKKEETLIAEFVGIDNYTIPDSFRSCCDELDLAHEKYDFIIFDLSLDNWGDYDKFYEYCPDAKYDFRCDAKVKKERGAEGVFEAGYDLYLNTALKGFPKNRMVFLTQNTTQGETYLNDLSILDGCKDLEDEDLISLANIYEVCEDWSSFVEGKSSADVVNIIREKIKKEKKSSVVKNTYEILSEQCKTARIKLPKCIKKSDEKKFVKWLKNHGFITEDERRYMILRRGIIDGCNDVLERLKQEPGGKLFNGLKKSDVVRTFRQAKLLFPLTRPEKFQELTYLFWSSMSTGWEKYDYKTGDVPHNKFIKLVRNWIAHDQIERTDVDEKLTALFFIILCRSLFRGHDEFGKIGYEKSLFTLFKTNLSAPSTNTLKSYVEKTYADLFEQLKCGDHKDSPFVGDKNYISLLEKYGNIVNKTHARRNQDDIKASSRKHLYLAILHGWFCKIDTSGSVPEGFRLNFRYNWRVRNGKLLGDAIYNELSL